METFSLPDLNERTRILMTEEIQRDILTGTLYFSNRLSDTGRKTYPDSLLNAAQNGSIASLATTIQTNGSLIAFETRRTKNGTTQAKVPYDAHEMLAEGEFNRFYIRAICRRAIEENKTIVVFRAKQVSNPRSESQRKIGQTMNPEAVLNDLRQHQGVDTALGLPPGPNSGLSIRLSQSSTETIPKEESA